jgi:hypothetical protein
LEVGDGAAGRGRQRYSVYLLYWYKSANTDTVFASSLEGALGSVRDIANAKAELQLLVPGSTQVRGREV